MIHYTQPVMPKQRCTSRAFSYSKIALWNCIKDVNIVDPIQMRRVHRDLMNEVSSEAQYISNKYNIKIKSLYFESNKFIPMLERQFPDILHEMLNCNHQWHPSNQNESRSTTSRVEEPNNYPRRRIRQNASTTWPRDHITKYKKQTSSWKAILSHHSSNHLHPSLQHQIQKPKSSNDPNH